MKAYARWCYENGYYFRDETILQFGNNWHLIANLILLNPGSVKPVNDNIVDDFLMSKKLLYLSKPTHNQHYYEFSLDPLMRNILKCFSKNYSGGVVKIYNLFNLKNSDSNSALKLSEIIKSKYLFTASINFLNKSVIFASGKSINTMLKVELKKFYMQAKTNKKYYLSKIADKEFVFGEVKNINNIFNSYYPSFLITEIKPFVNSKKIKGAI